MQFFLYEVVSWDLAAWDLVLAKSSCVAAPYPYNRASSILSINEPGLGIMGDVQRSPTVRATLVYFSQYQV